MAGTSVCVSCPGSAPARRRATRRSYRRAAPRRRRFTRRVVRRRVAPRMLRAMPRRLSKFELGQINPFSKEVYGAKIPDCNTQPSTTSVSEDRIVFTGAATDLAITKAFFPNLIANSVDSTTSTSSAWTWQAAYAGANASSVSTAFSASFLGVRPVAHGIRLSSQAAPTTVTGFVHVVVYPLDQYNQNTWNLPVNISQMAQLPWYRRYTLAQLTQTPVVVVNKFLDSTSSRYSDPASDLVGLAGDTVMQFAGGWCAILVAVEGGPLLGSNLSVENLAHYEVIPRFGTGSGSVFGTSPAAPFDTTKLENVSRIAGHSDAAFIDTPQAIADRFREVGAIIAQGASTAAGELYENVVVPAARGAGYAATYAGARYLSRRAGYSGGIPGINTPRLME